MKKTLLAGLCLGLLSLILGHTPAWAADAPVPMKTAWLGENEAFAVWYAKQHGWDKEVGLDISMLRFDSGKAIVEGVLAYDWAVAGCGAVPALTAALNERLDIIAVANDESLSNALYVRADSPILTVKGANPAFPEIYGDRATVAKKLPTGFRHRANVAMLKASAEYRRTPTLPPPITNMSAGRSCTGYILRSFRTMKPRNM